MNKYLWTSVKFLSLSSSLALIICAPLLSYAKEGDKKMDTASIMPASVAKTALMPNLTVNFKLNSILGEKETAYYAKIVEKILSDIPKTVELKGEEKDLLSGSNKYDTLKVVAYFPASGEALADNPLNKITKAFDIKFELPREKKLKRLVKGEDGARSVIEPKDSFDNFMSKVKDISKNGTSELIPAKALEVKAAIPVKEVKKIVKKVSPVSAKTKVKIKPVFKVVSLKYFDDTVTPSLKQVSSIQKIANAIKSSEHKGKTLNVTTQTAASPFSTALDIRRARLKSLKNALKKEDVDMDQLAINFIHLNSTEKQFIQIGF